MQVQGSRTVLRKTLVLFIHIVRHKAYNWEPLGGTLSASLKTDSISNRVATLRAASLCPERAPITEPEMDLKLTDSCLMVRKTIFPSSLCLRCS